MTLIIGATLNNYVLVAADTRVSWKHPISGESFKDHDHKIVNCKIGLVTGSGYTKALDSVKEELLRREINHTGEIEEIVNEKAIPKIRLLNKNYPEVKNKTSFLISYFTKTGDKQNVLRLAFLHPDWNYKISIVKETIVVMPFDVQKEIVEEYSNKLSKGITRCPTIYNPGNVLNESVIANITKNLFFIADCFNEISKKSKYVSKDFDYAVLFTNEVIIYCYVASSELKNGNFKLSVFHRNNHSYILSPNICSEGKIINIS
jgi:hypothetical protein